MKTMKTFVSLVVILSCAYVAYSEVASQQEQRFIRGNIEKKNEGQQGQRAGNPKDNGTNNRERKAYSNGNAMHIQNVIGTRPNLPAISHVIQNVAGGDAVLTSDRSYQGNDIQISSTDRIAILHIGPLKTASTSIQADIKLLRPELNLDNYEIPVAQGEINMGGIRDCFNIGQSKDKTCEPALVQNVHKLGMDDKKQHIIISAESFSFPDTNIFQFKKVIDSYWSKTIIVLYYRRYYDWLYSSWNQLGKFDNYHKRVSWVNYMTKDLYSMKVRSENQFYYSHYTYNLIPRWRGFYPSTTQVYNVHDESHMTNTEKFFCAALVNANNTCNKLRDIEKNHGEEHFNRAHDLIYEDLALLAIEQNLIPRRNPGDKPWSVKEHQKQLSEIVQYQQEKVWKLSKYDFIKSSIACLPDHILDDLLEKTLLAERDLFPDYYNSPNGEKVIREEFEKDRYTKLCSIDAGIVLKDDLKWKTFFQSSDDFYRVYDIVVKPKGKKNRA